MKKIILLVFAIMASFLFLPNLVKAAGPTYLNNWNINGYQAWTKEKSPYVVDDLYINFDLVIEPGVVVKMKREARITFMRKLTAVGTEEDKIIFTSYKDDNFAGDTNNDNEVSKPAPGDWAMLNLYGSQQEMILDNVGVYYGSIDNHVEGAVTVNRNNNIIIRNTEIKYSGYVGLYILESKPTLENLVISNNLRGILVWNPVGMIAKIENSSIFDNNLVGASVSGGVYGSDYMRLDARNNWWGDDSGPYYKHRNYGEDNLAGKGDRIVDGVIYNPWTGKKTKNPVIIVPGIMGSWKKHGFWVFDPILHTYDNLVEALIGAGYVKNETLFLFPYDWRQNNVLTAGLLKEKIDEIKAETNSSKVDIVAHSMGGLISRSYIQSSEYNSDVDQLIFLNTPHKGSPKSYLHYEGAYFLGDFFNLNKLTFQLEATEHGYLSLVKYIREQVPSVEQLLPDYSYLEGKSGSDWVLRPYPVSYPRNTFLENLNIEPAVEALNQRVKVTNIISQKSIASSTLGAIRVAPDSNIYDNKWPDGEPVCLGEDNLDCLINETGDGTVPFKSLDFDFGGTTIEMLGPDHQGIVTEAQKQVIEVLINKIPEEYYKGPWSAIKRMLFIRVYSPVDFVVTSPSGQSIGKDFLSNSEIDEIPGAFYSGFDSETEFVSIPNPEEGKYEIKLQGTGNGQYKLGVDILDEESLLGQEENLINGSISAGEEQSFSFDYSSSSSEILISKKTIFSDLILHIKDLYENEEIVGKFMKEGLLKQVELLDKKYDTIKTKQKVWQKIIKKQIELTLNAIIKKLEFYLKKDWLSQNAYDILISDIEKIINQLN